MIESPEFKVKILTKFNDGAVLPHNDLSINDWYNVFDIFSRAQLNEPVDSEHVIGTSDVEDCGDLVDFAYWEVLWRGVDPSGREHHERLLGQGAMRAGLVTALCESSEAVEKQRKVRLANPSDGYNPAISKSFVELCYIALLNRRPDEGGLRHNAQALQSGEGSHRSVFKGLFESAEGIALRRNRPGAEAIVWYLPLTVLLTCPFIEQAIVGLYGEAGRQFVAGLRYRDLTALESAFADRQALAEVYRGRPLLLGAPALAIYHNLV